MLFDIFPISFSLAILTSNCKLPFSISSIAPKISETGITILFAMRSIKKTAIKMAIIPTTDN
ncbi:hypothetical protein SDC9_169792 [bioreactor metagenome]|uniref:Uncharacterized protein n=1 Tax=bioreactor metagenome TaxID=1076179 RepID=A0A645G9D1_9ZZZZ